MAQICQQRLEQFEGLGLVFIERVALGIAAEADDRAQMVKIDQMLTPQAVQGFQQDLFLDKGGDAFVGVTDSVSVGISTSAASPGHNGIQLESKSQIAAAGGLTRDDFESCAAVHERLLQSFTSNGAASVELDRMTKIERQFVGRIMADRIASASVDTVKAIAGSPAYLSTVDLISGVANDPAAEEALKRLVQVLPTRKDVLNAFFSLPKLSSSLKAWWLKNYLRRKEQFPEDCPHLWVDGTQPNTVVLELLRSSTIEQVSAWSASVPREFAWSFAAALCGAVQYDPAKRPLLVSAIESIDDDGLCKLLEKHSGRGDRVLKTIQPDTSRLLARLKRLEDQIQSAPPDKVTVRVETLLGMSSYFPELRRWIAVREAIERCKQHGTTSNGRSPGELEASLCDVLKAVSAAISKPDRVVSPIEINVKLVEPLLRSWLGSNQLLLCQQSIILLPKLQLAATDDTDLCVFLASTIGEAWLRRFPRDDSSLTQRLRTILDDLPDNLSSLSIRLAGLMSAKSWLAVDAGKLSAWVRLKEVLECIKRLRSRSSSASQMKPSDLHEHATDLAPLVFIIFGSRISCDQSKENTKKLSGTKYIENLSRATIGDNTLLEAKMLVFEIEREYEKQSSSKGLGMIKGLFK